MNKERKLRNQIFASIGTAILMIIGSATYLFTSLSQFNNYNLAVVEKVQNQLEVSTKLNYNLFKLINEIENESSGIDNNLYYISLISQNLYNLKQLTRSSNDQKIINFFNHTESIIDKIANKADLSTTSWSKEHEKTVLSFNAYIEAIILDRNMKLANNESEFNTIKYNTLLCILICLIVIVYAVYKFYGVIKHLEKTSADLKLINKEFDEAKSDIESTNWILENNTLMTDNIRGIDDASKIGKLVISTLNEILPIQAATIYIRKPDSYEFELIEQTGTDMSETKIGFGFGDGYLGKLVEEKKIILQDIEQASHLNTSSSLIKKFRTIVFICPLVQDNYCFGLLEVALQIKDNREIKKLYDFFLRISNTIAGKIKFGQSHFLVEQLLLETQRQTEELEAQQEELRITNEELIHKTNLLESSEEELSVQQEELSQTNAELILKAIELEKRNTELNSTQKIVELKIKEVELASKYKSEFMANMSHELRTPLNSILILAKLLQDNKLDNLTPEQTKYAGVIHSAGSDLLELINDLLDLAKIEAGKIELNQEIINTEVFSDNIFELFSAISKEKEIDFQAIIHPSAPKEFITDEYRLQQVIKNFLSNAFKFTDKAGQVIFTISKVENNLYFQVKDSGKGISLEKQKIIFEAFKQEDGSTSRKYGGTGLGLSISKQIATLLEGEIALESQLGIGSTFAISIPAHINSDEIVSTKPIKQEIKKPEISLNNFIDNNDKIKTLLIIEDDINFADTLKSFAEENGYETYLAHDGLKGIELANKIVPDAIILDVILPIKDGWEVLKTIKNNDSTQHIPIHMMSGTAYDKIELLEKGVIGFMHKPVTKEVIQNTFDNINININQSIKKILLIEDIEVKSDFIKDSFAKQNILIIHSFSIQEAIEKLNSENDIDCIILALNLPDGSGLELFEIIKEMPHHIDTPIIIHTDHKLSQEEQEKVLLLADTTIVKSEKINSKLLDEVNLFLNKIKDQVQQPLKGIDKINNLNSLKDKTVLVADDDMRNIFALTTSLQSYDMKVEVANTGKEAIEILKNNGSKIDIVLMDIMMPEMDGYEAIKIIRNDLKLKNLPVLAVTAKAMKGDRDKSIQSGANDYISKPIDLNKLISLMNVWLS